MKRQLLELAIEQEKALKRCYHVELDIPKMIAFIEYYIRRFPILGSRCFEVYTDDDKIRIDAFDTEIWRTFVKACYEDIDESDEELKYYIKEEIRGDIVDENMENLFNSWNDKHPDVPFVKWRTGEWEIKWGENEK
jgi:hypothetical protein